MVLKGIISYVCYCAVSQGSPVDKAKTDEENLPALFYYAKTPTEYSGLSKFAYFRRQNLNRKPFFSCP